MKLFVIYLQSSSRILKLARKGSETKEKGGAAMWLLPALWHETSVKNTSSKRIGRKNSRKRHNHSGVNDACFCTGSSAESYTLSRRILNPSCPLSSNTFQVCSYRTEHYIPSFIFIGIIKKYFYDSAF